MGSLGRSAATYHCGAYVVRVRVRIRVSVRVSVSVSVRVRVRVRIGVPWPERGDLPLRRLHWAEVGPRP